MEFNNFPAVFTKNSPKAQRSSVSNNSNRFIKAGECSGAKLGEHAEKIYADDRMELLGVMEMFSAASLVAEIDLKQKKRLSS